MIAWNTINNKTFEDLAYEYMSSNYPNLKWEKTKLTNDGNKDGECIISNLPMDTTIKYWYEAKYTINTSHSIPKSHLDSTLVSSILDGHVVVIAFITNAYISDDYKRRADIFARHRDNLRIYYINGEEIENWLADNPKIENKYFHTSYAQKYSAEEKIETACFLNKYNYADTGFVKLTTIELRKEYLLYIRFNSNQKQMIDIISDDSYVFLQEYSNDCKIVSNYYVEKGNNSLFLPIKVQNDRNEYTISIKSNNGINKFTIDNIKTLDLFSPQLFISSQIKMLNDINLFVKTNNPDNLFFLITGEAGSGKTYLLNLLCDNMNAYSSSIMFKFSGNIENDNLLCYKIFIYCQFGNIWDLQIDDYTAFNLSSLVKDVLKEINIGISSGITCEKIIKYCKEKSSIIIEELFLQQQIYIDDIHKALPETLDLFQIIIDWISNQRLYKRLFLFSRPTLSTNETFNDYIKKTVHYDKEIQNPTIKDIEYSVTRNIGEIPLLIPQLLNSKANINALLLYDLLCSLKEKYEHINSEDIIARSVFITEIVEELKVVQHNQVAYRLFDDYSSYVIFELIYRLESGVDICALVDFFGERIFDEISILCKKNIIKEISGKLYPFHDLLLDEFRFKRKSTSEEDLGGFILFCIQNKYMSNSEGYCHLLSLGGKFFWKYRNIAIELRDSLHNRADYCVAEKIAKKIEEENNKDLIDYEYSDVKNLFILGNCYKYTTSYDMSNAIFDKILEIYNNTVHSLHEDILIETYSEKINNLIWMLKINKADAELNKMLIKLSEFNISYDSSKASKYAYLNYYNRRMLCNYMKNTGSKDDYKLALAKAKELELIEYEGFAHMDYARSIYNIDMSTALELLETAKVIFQENNEQRRYYDSLCEIVFVNALQKKDYSLSEMQRICKIMKDNKYTQSYIRTNLKILVMMLLSEKYTVDELLDKVNFMLVGNKAILSSRRHQALIYHVLAAIYYYDDNLFLSSNYSNKCLELFTELGEDYKKIHHHNASLHKKRSIVLASVDSTFSSNDFVLDTRIW